MTLGLTRDTAPDDVSRALFRETKRRGYTRAESVAVGSTGFQESGLRMVYSPNGKWGGYFQQDTSYPGRDDPNQNILGFLDRLDQKRRSPGASADPFKNIFWLQQRPSEKSADAAYANGRKAYYDEIRRHVHRAEQLYDSLDAAPAPAPAAAPPARAPYGLPNGTRITYGSPGFPQWVYDLGRAFNVKASTYPGHQETDRIEFGYARNPQRLNRGIDWSGPVADMQRFADYLFSIRGELEQLIWQNPNTMSRRGVAGGKDVGATAYYDYDGGYNGHRDHVHTRQDHALPVPGNPGVATPVNPALAKPAFTEIERFGNGSSPRTRPPINWLLHTEEGNATAEGLAKFCDGSNGVSYHYTLRDGIVCDVVDTDLASWSVLSANAFTINLCFAGSRAAWSRNEWLQRERDIEIAAYLAVQDCRKYNIPTVVIAPPYRQAAGISDHKYVTQQLGIGNHTDVGNNFPWDVFARYVAKYANPTTPSTPGDDMALVPQEQWDRVYRELTQLLPSRSPLRFLDQSKRYPNGVDTLAGMLLNVDGMQHVEHIRALAGYGHPETLAHLRELAAADPVKYPDRQDDRLLAQAILADVTSAPAVTATSAPVAADSGDAASGAIKDAYAQSLKASLESVGEENERLRAENARLEAALSAAQTVTYRDVPAALTTAGGSTGELIGRAYDALDALRLADALPIEGRAPLAALVSVLQTKNGASLS